MPETITINTDLDSYQVMIREIRRALVLGLESFGEVERLSDEVSKREMWGETIDDELKPIHPTGCNNTIGEFASALRWVEIMENEADRASTIRKGPNV